MAITVQVQEMNKNFTITATNDKGGNCTAHLTYLSDSVNDEGTGMYNTGYNRLVTLVDLITDVDHLNQKLATAVMEKICQIADSDHLNIELCVDAQFNYSEEALGNSGLEKFFKKYGFKYIPKSGVIMVREYSQD